MSRTMSRPLFKSKWGSPSPQQIICSSCRACAFSQSRIVASGHSKWATIKHEKARNDAVKTKQRSTAAKSIADASRNHGPDPKNNPQLAAAIANAKRSGMQKASIETAVLRGQGKSSTGAALDAITIEALLHPVALIIECDTDNKARALPELRAILRENGATTTPISYLFDRRGRIAVARGERFDFDKILEVALEAGALDVQEVASGIYLVDTEPSALKAVETKLARSLPLEMSSETLWLPNPDTLVKELEHVPFEKLRSLTYQLEEYPGVRAVHSNLASNPEL